MLSLLGTTRRLVGGHTWHQQWPATQRCILAPPACSSSFMTMPYSFLQCAASVLQLMCAADGQHAAACRNPDTGGLVGRIYMQSRPLRTANEQYAQIRGRPHLRDVGALTAPHSCLTRSCSSHAAIFVPVSPSSTFSTQYSLGCLRGYRSATWPDSSCGCAEGPPACKGVRTHGGGVSGPSSSLRRLQAGPD